MLAETLGERFATGIALTSAPGIFGDEHESCFSSFVGPGRAARSRVADRLFDKVHAASLPCSGAFVKEFEVKRELSPPRHQGTKQSKGNSLYPLLYECAIKVH